MCLAISSGHLRCSCSHRCVDPNGLPDDVAGVEEDPGEESVEVETGGSMQNFSGRIETMIRYGQFFIMLVEHQ